MADKIKGSTIASTFQRVLLRDKDADIGADAAAVNIEVQKIDADVVADSSLSISTNRLGINATTPQKALHVVGDVYVTGNLEIDGTTTTIDSTAVTVADQNIVLGNVAVPDNTTADGGGITLLGTTSKTLNWVSANSAWTSSEHIDIVTGKTYRINNVSMLSNTTLGSSVVTSSLTTVGTISTGTWEGTTIAVNQGGTGVTTSTGTTNVVLSGSPTIVTPTIASMTNAQHSHTNAAGGGTITEGSISDLGTLTAMVADNLSVFAATTSAQLAGIISDETGSGTLVFGTSPTLVTPALGAATATSLSAGAIVQTGTGALTLPVGTDAQQPGAAEQPAAAQGMVRYNTSDTQFEGYSGSAWEGLGGIIDADLDTHIKTLGADDDILSFTTAGSIAMTIDESQQVGIGTESPDRLLSLSSIATPILELHTSDTTITNEIIGQILFTGEDDNHNANNIGAQIQARAAGAWGTGASYHDAPSQLEFWTNSDGAADPPAQNMTIDKDGNVGIGHTAPFGNLMVANSTGASLRIHSDSDDIDDGDDLGHLLFAGRDSSGALTSNVGAKISAFCQTADWDTTTNINIAPTKLQFFTQDESVTDTIAAGPRMTIDKDGKVGIGATTVDTNLHVEGTASTYIKIEAADDGQNAGIYMAQNGVTSWSIYTDGGLSDKLIFLDEGSANTLTLQQDGKIGIGTVTPTDNLTIAGKAASNATIEVMTNAGATDAAKWRMRSNTDNAFYIDNKGTGSYTQKLKLSRTGSIDTVAIAGVDAFEITEGSTNIHIPGSLTVTGSISSVDNVAGDQTWNGGYLLNEQGRQDHVANTMPGAYYHFDGDSDYISVPDSIHIEPPSITIEAWVYPTDFVQENVIVEKGYASAFEMSLDEPTGFVHVNANINGSYRANMHDGGLVAVANQWNHVVWTYDKDSNTSTTYLNGVLSETLTPPAGDGTGLGTNSYNLFIGCRSGPLLPFPGGISSVRLYNVALSAAEIKSLYSGASVPFKYKGATQTALITGDDSTFDADQGNWTESSGGSNGESITYDAVSKNIDIAGLDISDNDAYVWVPMEEEDFVPGKAYHIKCTVESTTGTWQLDYYAAGPVYKEITTGTGAIDYIWIAPTDIGHVGSGFFRLLANTGTATLTGFDNFTVTQIGAVAEYDAKGLTHQTWFDNSGNNLHGAVTNATPVTSSQDGITDVTTVGTLRVATEHGSMLAPSQAHGGFLYTKADGKPYWKSADYDLDLSALAGTTDGWSSGTGKVYVTSTTDKVGIGTATPNSILDAVEAVSGGIADFSLRNSVDAANSHSRLQIQAGGASAGDCYVFYDTQRASTWYSGVDVSDSSKFKIGIGESLAEADKFTITTDGWVGIGTTSPDSYVHIGQVAGASGTHFTEGLRIDRDQVPTQYAILNTIGGSMSYTAVVEGGGDGGSHTWYSHNAASGTPTQRMTILGSNGYVGINEGAPDSMLEVGGDIKCSGNFLDASGAILTGVDSDSFWLDNGGGTINFGGDIAIGEDALAITSGYHTIQIGSTGSGSLLRLSNGSNDSCQMFYDVNGIGFSTNDGARPIRWKAGIISGATDSHMFLNTSGQLGIGTASPASVLDVAGALGADITITRFDDSITVDNTIGNIVWRMVDADGTTNSDNCAIIQVNAGETHAGDNFGSNMMFYTASNTSSALAARMTILGSGKVGIGTTEPAKELHVKDASANAVVRVDSYTDHNASIDFCLNGVQKWSLGNDSIGHGSGVNAFYISDDGDERFCIEQGTGNVGIGTTTPSAELEVDGTIKATAINIGGSVYDASNLSAYWSQTGNDIYYNYNVGIGTSTPDHLLEISHNNNTAVTAAAIQGNTISGLHMAMTGNNNDDGSVLKFSSYADGINTAIAHIQKDTNSADLAFYTEGSSTFAERMRIDANGKVGIGTDVPGSLLEVRGGTGTGHAGAGILTLSTEEEGIADNDVLGMVQFQAPLANNGGAGDQQLPAAAIWAEAEATFSTTVNSCALVFATADGETAIAGANERMRIDNDGKVGIGETAPSALLHIKGGGYSAANLGEVATNAFVRFQTRSDGEHSLWITDLASGEVGLQVTDDDADALNDLCLQPFGGLVGIGTNAPVAKFEVHSHSTTITGNQAFVASFIGNGYNNGEVFVGDAADQAIDIGGEIQFGGKYKDADSEITEWAAVGGYKENSSSGNYAGFIVLQTRADGGTLTERLRLNSTGMLNLGIYGVGTLTSDSSGNITASDARLKNVEKKLDKGLEYVNQMNPVYYKWKEDSGFDTSELELGFLAQEIGDIIPEAAPVCYEKLEDGSNGEEKHRNYSDRALLAVYAKAIQELSAKVEALEAAAA